MSCVRAVVGALVTLAMTVAAGHAQEPFYKGKRLTVLVNFAPGGPTDIEGRLFAKYRPATSTASPTSSCRTWTAPAA